MEPVLVGENFPSMFNEINLCLKNFPSPNSEYFFPRMLDGICLSLRIFPSPNQVISSPSMLDETCLRNFPSPNQVISSLSMLDEIYLRNFPSPNQVIASPSMLDGTCFSRRKFSKYVQWNLFEFEKLSFPKPSYFFPKYARWNLFEKLSFPKPSYCFPKYAYGETIWAWAASLPQTQNMLNWTYLSLWNFPSPNSKYCFPKHAFWNLYE